MAILPLILSGKITQSLSLQSGPTNPYFSKLTKSFVEANAMRGPRREKAVYVM
jgi:hypothetical protein